MSFWKGRKVLVTGCAGLMGAPMCKALLDAGAALTGFDVKPPGILGHYQIAHAFPVIQHDICERGEVFRALQGQEVVIHLAAISGVEASRADPWVSWRVNVLGALAVLEMSRRLETVKAIVVASSNHIYGKQVSYPVKEDAPLNQLDTYSASKIAVDVLARSYAHNYGLPVAVIRNTNCFGPYDPHGDHIVPGTILSVLKGQRPVIRGRGTTKKSYLYVDDVVAAYLMVAAWLASGGEKGHAFNVSTTPVSVLDLVREILGVMQSDLEPEIWGQGNDQADEWLSWMKVKEMVGWRPQWTLQDGLRQAVEGFRVRQEISVG